MDDEGAGSDLEDADVVEVAPAYQGGQGEETALAAAQAVYEILSSMVKRALGEVRREKEKDVVGKDEL